MRYTVLAVVTCVALGTAGAAQAQDPQLMAPIQKFLDAFNKGDAAGAAATHLADDDLVIIDEVPPHVWRGAGAFKAWSDDLASSDKKKGITDQAVTIGKPAVAQSEGDYGYVVVPATYTFKQGGKPMHEAAHMVFALKKTPGGWMIHAWTWTGTVPVPAPGKAPAKP